jgi:hypothetical protein
MNRPNATERLVLHKENKRYCNICKDIKSLDSFTTDLGCADGYRYTCRQCASNLSKEYREANRVKNLAKQALREQDIK